MIKNITINSQSYGREEYLPNSTLCKEIHYSFHPLTVFVSEFEEGERKRLKLRTLDKITETIADYLKSELEYDEVDRYFHKGNLRYPLPGYIITSKNPQELSHLGERETLFIGLHPNDGIFTNQPRNQFLYELIIPEESPLKKDNFSETREELARLEAYLRRTLVD